jgi:hypothetical protein
MFATIAIDLGTAAGLLIALVCSLEAGYRLGRRAVRSGEDSGGGQIGAIQGALLGLLGLLLGFSFAGAASRFLERQDLIVEEANAIGTAYLRADLLDEPHGGHMRKALAEYVRHRLDATKSLAAGLSPDTAAQVNEFHTRLWNAARDGVVDKPEATLAVLNPVNEVIDLHSTRVAAGRKHLPALVLGLLIGCSLLAIAVIGYGCGISGRRSLSMTVPLAVLIAATLWTTIDLDHPRAGLIRLSDAPLEELNLSGSP